jgi:hypothetical protein
MTQTSALVVGEPSRVTRELGRALRAGGFDVRHATAADLDGPSPAGEDPDMVLVSATVGLRRVALISQQFIRGGRAPATVVFPDGDLTALESCVGGGFDYIVPPFRPGLLRTRLTSCWERGQLTMAVEEMATAASLRTYERDLHIAHEIQSGFLPEELPAPHGWQVAARFRPARQVAGDFYDAFDMVGGRRLGLVIADVCDKGVGAALFMALIRTLLRHSAEQATAWTLFDDAPRPPRPATASTNGWAQQSSLSSAAAGSLLQAVTSTNRYMARNHWRQAYFATLFFAVLDPVSGTLVYINGGHNPPVLVRADGQHLLLDPTGPAVGMFPNSVYSLGHVNLQPGDALFMYTDGVTESRNTDGGLFGLDRTLEVVTRAGRTAEALLTAVDDATRHHAGAAEQWDDITMLALCRAMA